MIEPTIGRQVWYTAGQVPDTSAQSLSDQPFAATVVHVNDDATVNLAVLDHNGKSHFVPNCPLSQDDHKKDVDADKAHCAWMPYQKATAVPETKGKKP